MVTITGTNFGTTADTDVTFDGMGGTVSAVSSTSITVTTPSHAAGEVDVVVSAPGGHVHATDGFTYMAAPTVTLITPHVGPIGGGTVVTITGTNFHAPGTSVTFGGTAGTSHIRESGRHGASRSPPRRTGWVRLKWIVDRPRRPTSTWTDGFTYMAAPTVATIVPDTGPTVGGTVVIITGTNFHAPGTSVTFGGTAGTSHIRESGRHRDHGHHPVTRGRRG